MDKPIKPNVDLPSSFGGIKENFASSKISSGYEPNVRDILGGANLNYLLDTWGKRQTYYDTIVDFVNGLPSGKFITTDSNNKLIYADLQQYTKRGIGETIFSLLPLTSSDVHLLDGGVLENGVYSEFYSYIVGLYTGGTCPNCFCSEEQWQASVTQYGACAKFVIDSVNQTIRLPRIVGMVEGTVDVNYLDDLVAAGLPSVTHTHTFSGTTSSQNALHTHSGVTGTMNQNWAHTHSYDRPSTAPASGYIAGSAYIGAYGSEVGWTDTNHTHNFDTGTESAEHQHTYSGTTSNNATLSGIYGNSATVQPQTIKGFYYIVIANTQADTYTLQLDDVATDLNGKVSKSGDIMTGGLTLNTNNPSLTLKNPNLDITSTTAPAALIVGGQTVVIDQNNNFVSSWFATHDTNNNFATGVSVSRSVNNVVKNGRLGVFVNSDGFDNAFATDGVRRTFTTWAYPSSRYDNLALGASGTQYTAPADGYVWIGGKQSDESGFVFLKNVNNGIEVVSQPPNVSSYEVRVFIPVSKGQLYEVNYGNVYIYWFRFIYANGEA